MRNLKTVGTLKLVASLLTLVCVVLIIMETTNASAQQVRRNPGLHMWGPGKHWRKDWEFDKMSPRHRHRMQRHWTFMNGNIPARFQNSKNPYGDSETAIVKGEKLYAANCASCHGVEGLGEGEAGNDLYPSPALLAFIVQMPIAADSYLMWTISEGGKDFNTEMPAFKGTLNDDEIWQVIAYIRNGFALP